MHEDIGEYHGLCTVLTPREGWIFVFCLDSFLVLFYLHIGEIPHRHVYGTF